MLLSLGVLADDDGVICFCGACEASGQRENLQGVHLFAVVGEHKSARPADRAQNVHNPSMGHGYDIAGLQKDIIRGISGFH